MAARKTGGLGRGLDALIPNKAGGTIKGNCKKDKIYGKERKNGSTGKTCGRTSCKNFQCGTESESAEKAF